MRANITMICLLGLGASLGEHMLGGSLRAPANKINSVLAALSGLPHSELLACSDFYLSRAWGNQRAGQYLNAAAVLATGLMPMVLMQKLLAIEFAAGRRRQRRQWNKRAIDVDMLLYANCRIQAAQLTIPHAWFWQREFALLPAATLSHLLPRPWPQRIRQQQGLVQGYHLGRPLRILSTGSR